MNATRHSRSTPLHVKQIGRWLAIGAGVLQGFTTGNLLAAPSQDLLSQLSIEELLDIRVSTASVMESPWIRQPASISVFDFTTIDNTPARYLEDILEWVPGTSMGVDVFGVTSLNFRGHWAHEGKVLLLVDGMPVNDMLYGDLNLQRHYPAAQIQKVEVLRGAGTAKYGGNAQLAVIRVTTMDEARKGFYSQFSGNWVTGAGWGTLGSVYGNVVDASKEMRIQFTAHRADSPYSGRQWQATDGEIVDLDALTGIESWNTQFKFQWKHLNAQFSRDFHQSRTPHSFGFVRMGETVSFENNSLLLSYDFRPSDAWLIRPSLLYRDQNDWYIDRDPAVQPIRDFLLNATQRKAAVDVTYNGDFWDLQFGVEAWNERGFAESPGGMSGDVTQYFAGERSVGYHGAATYLQADWQAEHWVFSSGVRHSGHDYSGNSTVPRFSLGYIADPWHLKINAGQAFREPDIEVINASDWDQPAMRPEKTTSVDLELGKTFSRTSFGTVTLFYVQIQDPIIYTSSTDYGSYYYFNNSTVKTWGVETDWRYRGPGSSFHFSYSFYRTANDPIEIYRVPGKSSVHNGVPAHKFSVNSQWHLPWRGWSFESSGIAYLETYGWVYDANSVDFQGYPLKSTRLKDRVFIHTGLRYKQDHWSLRLRVFDLLDTGREYVQPYHSESTPYPGSGREVVFTFEWDW